MQGTLPALTRSRVKISKNEKHSFLNLPMLNPMIPDSDLFLFHPFPIVSCKNEKHGFSKSRAILPPRNVKWPILRPPLVFSRVAGATAASHSAFDSSRALVSKTYFAFQIGGGRNFALQRQTRPAPGANLQFSTREPTKGAVGARSTGESGNFQVIGFAGWTRQVWGLIDRFEPFCLSECLVDWGGPHAGSTKIGITFDRKPMEPRFGYQSTGFF